MIIKQKKNAHYKNDEGNKTDIYCIKKQQQQQICILYITYTHKHNEIK